MRVELYTFGSFCRRSTICPNHIIAFTSKDDDNMIFILFFRIPTHISNKHTTYMQFDGILAAVFGLLPELHPSSGDFRG